ANVAGKHDDGVEFSISYESPDAGIDQAKKFSDYGMRGNISELYPRIVVEQGNVPSDLDVEVGVDMRLCAFQAAIRDECFEVRALRHEAPHGRAVLRWMRAHQKHPQLLLTHFAASAHNAQQLFY